MKLKPLIIEALRDYITEYRLITKTQRGEVYEDGDKIIKITKDVIEYNNAKILVDNPSRVFVRYHSVEAIGDNRYKLIMEKLTPLTDAECAVVDLIQNSLGKEEYMLNDNKRFSFIQELKNNPEYYVDFASFKEVSNMLLLLKRMYLEAKTRNIKLFDLRCDNMGKRSNAEIVHFDLGSG